MIAAQAAFLSQSQYTKQNLKPSGFPAINNLSLVNVVEMIETRNSLMTVRRETIVSKFCCWKARSLTVAQQNSQQTPTISLERSVGRITQVHRYWV